MATYSSYKKIDGASIIDNTITSQKVGGTAFQTWCVKWFYGQPNFCSGGCCCLWTVPNGVFRAFIELWGSGGNGHGMCVNNRCQHYAGAQGGYYNSKMLNVCPGWQYTVCAAGVFPCLTNECIGCTGCSSYVNGCGLSNFCAIGGIGGCANDNWNTGCFSDWGNCCIVPGGLGGDFAMGNHRGAFFVHPSQCHCHCMGSTPTPAPFIGTQVQQQIHECWMRCACWTVPYAHGGQGAMTTYCGSNCCGQGGTGGSGMVKISFL